MTPPSEVIQQRRNQRWKKKHGNGRDAQQSPVKPRNAGEPLRTMWVHGTFWRSLYALQHPGPQISRRFRLAHGRDGASQSFTKPIPFFVV
jgi:hypothetical protein